MKDKPNLLCIDDEERILNSLRMIFRKSHHVFTTTCPDEFAELLTKHKMHVVISDQRMPAIKGTELLNQVIDISPNSMRILLTGYADVSAVVDSINEGEIFRYVTKPWDNDSLKATVQQATEIALKTQTEPKTVANQGKAHDEKATKQIKVTKPPVLFMFDDAKICDAFKVAFKDQYDIFIANNLLRAQVLLSKQSFSVAITDTHFDGEDIAPLIYLLKQRQPELVSIVMTGSPDIESLVDLINKGQVFRCLPKPIRKKILRRSLEHAVAKHEQLKQDAKQQLRYSIAPSAELDRAAERFSGLSGLLGRLSGLLKPKPKAKTNRP